MAKSLENNEKENFGYLSGLVARCYYSKTIRDKMLLGFFACTKARTTRSKDDGIRNTNQQVNCRDSILCVNDAIGHNNKQNLHCDLTTLCINGAEGIDQTQKMNCISVGGDGCTNLARDVGFDPDTGTIDLHIANIFPHIALCADDSKP